MEDFTHVVSFQSQRLSRRNGEKPITFSTVDYAGYLTVTEPVLFLQALRSGLGKSKALGCGLLMIKRGNDGFYPLNPIPLKDRTSMVFLQYGQIDVIDGAFVLVDKTGIRTHIPLGSVACIMLEPGTRVSHAAVRLAATAGTLLVWVGEAGVRLYASGQPGGARSDRLLYQAKLALDDELRLKVVRKMFELRFGEPALAGVPSSSCVVLKAPG